MIEVITKSFATDTKAFRLHVIGKTIAEPSARAAWEHESQLFIEGFKITYNGLNCGLPGCYDNLNVEHWSRHCAVCSYKFHASSILSAGQSWETCNDARRTKAKLSGNFAQSSYNYTFTFWNCA